MMHALVAFAFGPVGRYVVAALFGMALIAGIYLKGRSDGSAAMEAEAVRNAASRIQQMEKDNAEFRTMPELDRCRALARSSGLPVIICD